MAGSCGDEQRCYGAFSDALYKHPILHRSFIAHYDRCGFFQTHFAYPAATARLLRQFDASANFGRAEEFAVTHKPLALQAMEQQSNAGPGGQPGPEVEQPSADGQQMFQQPPQVGRPSAQRAEQQPKGGSSPVEPLDQEGLNMVLLIQVPLKQKEPGRGFMFVSEDTQVLYQAMGAAGDVEDAVIRHGRPEGPFTEIDNLEIKRDDRFPIRVTVQFYKATSTGIVSDEDMAQIAAQINRVYQEADYVGSLVVEGDSGRPTEHSGPKFQPPDWWERFWERHFADTGQTREEAIAMLEKLLGRGWTDRGRPRRSKRSLAAKATPPKTSHNDSSERR